MSVFIKLQETELSANTVYTIFSNITKEGKTEYTSKELLPCESLWIELFYD